MTFASEIIGAAALVPAIVGAILVNKRDRRGFICWLVANVLSCALHVSLGSISLCVRDVIFTGLTIDGLRRWGRIDDRMHAERADRRS